jgi:hypothetical protein
MPTMHAQYIGLLDAAEKYKIINADSDKMKK